MPHFADPDQALQMLRKVASCVKPIMRKHGWRVGNLHEIDPRRQSNLLGLNQNRGQHIFLLLRRPQNTNVFLPFEEVLDTMLHELCHNDVGPHNTKFHALWNQLRDEWVDLQLKGFSGDGFLGKGYQLGGGYIPRDELRRQARQRALEERERQKAAAAKQGRKLGGSKKPSSVRDAVAIATINRNTASTTSIDQGCATGSKTADSLLQDAIRNGYGTKEEMSEADNIAIQMAMFELMEAEESRILDQEAGTSYSIPHSTPHDDFASEGLTWDPQNGLQPVRNRPSRDSSNAGFIHPYPGAPAISTEGYAHPSAFVPARQPTPRTVIDLTQSPIKPKAHSIPQASAGSSQRWTCNTCTLINETNVKKCAVCESSRPTSKNALGSTKVSSFSKRNPTSTKSFTSSAKAAFSTSRTSSSKITKQPAPPKTLGWGCNNCGAFMEHQWWTCTACGRMKSAS